MVTKPLWQLILAITLILMGINGLVAVIPAIVITIGLLLAGILMLVGK